MTEKKLKSIFIEGPIQPSFIAESIAKHSTKKNIGAHSIFLGQVRNDIIKNNEVQAIEYTSYVEMANTTMHTFREELFLKYELTCMHVYHSIGLVKSGEICLFVFTSSKRRKSAMQACEELVEFIKKDLPIWGKEYFNEEDYCWKKPNALL